MARLTLNDMQLSPGKRVRLHRLLYTYGPGHGMMKMLPIDQGLEHGPRDFFVNPDSKNPEFQLRVALEGGFSGIAFQIGLAEKYIGGYAGRVPLVLKLNGKTEIPPDDAAFSPLNASVRDAVRLGADAVGYTCYVGSPSQDKDFIQFSSVRCDAERYGMPVIMWAYPRGKYMEQKGGRDSFYAVDYAARVAQELGADVVKVNVPKVNAATQGDSPKPYNELKPSTKEMLEHVVASAGQTLVIISGGAKKTDDDLIDTVRTCLEAGVAGFIFGRNIWQRPFPEALQISERMSHMMIEVQKGVLHGASTAVA
jgi:fructose-bisphosphate aldolase, class I